MRTQPSQVRVWLVRESVYVSTVRETPTGGTIAPCQQQDLFVLATSLAEAVETVSSAPGREIVLVQEVCPITYLDGSKWRIVPNEPVKT